MKQTINLYDFRTAFAQMRPENFSYDGLKVLFEYLEELELSSGEEMELDVIGICCDFSEIELDDVIGEDEDGTATSEDAVGEIVGKTEFSVIIFNT